VRNVGDVDAQFPAALAELVGPADGDGVVVVLGVGRVDGDDELARQVLAVIEGRGALGVEGRDLRFKLARGLASTVGLLPPNENWPKAEAATNKAFALDDTLAENYNLLAAVKKYYYRDWPAAERYFRRGIELNPNFAEIHAHYAINLMYFGRNEEALAEVRRSIELDPLSPRFNYFWGQTFFSMRQYDRAIDQLRKTLEIDPNYVMAHETLGYAYEQKGMKREAVAEWSKALTLRGAGEQALSLERTYAASGFEAAVRALAREQLAKLNVRAKGEYVPAGEYVTAYTLLGDKEQAFAWLNKAVEERSVFVFEVKINPIYDKLRDDQRFQAVMRSAGLLL